MKKNVLITKEHTCVKRRTDSEKFRRNFLLYIEKTGDFIPFYLRLFARTQFFNFKEVIHETTH